MKKQSNPRDEIYLQLHDQYATNNNANLGTIMTLVVSLVVVIGYYGYIFIHTSTDNINKEKTELAYNVINNAHFNQAKDGDIYVTNKTYFNQAKKSQGSFYDAQSETYSLEALSLIYCGSIFILGILFCVCTYQGISQRKEQFIIYAIRQRYDVFTNVILPDGYHPFNKKGLAVIQGLYGELVKIFMIVAVILCSITLYKLCDKACITCNLVVCSAIIVGYCFYYFIKRYASYMDRQLEYTKMKYPEADGNRITEIKNKNCLCKICEGEKYIQELEKDRKDKGYTT